MIHQIRNVFLLLAMLPSYLFAQNQSAGLYESLQQEMKEFETNTFVYMTKDMDFLRIPAKDATRSAIIGSKTNVTILAPPSEFDMPYHLIDNPQTLISNLSTIDSMQIYSAKLDPATQPWSDDYWPHYKGMTAKRYAESKYIGLNDFLYNMSLVTTQQSALSAIWGNQHAVENDWNVLSPAEKYDLLIGYDTVPTSEREALRRRLGYNDYNIPDGLLTPHQWSEGANYYYRSKFVESWMGLCHGWAAASYVVPRPSHSIELPAANNPNRKIKFYPSDIKALTTLLWSSQTGTTKYAGGRCYDQNPTVDPETGRVISQDCFDTNPSAFHLSLVHQIAREKRSFIMDATYDYQVWNHPIIGYHYVYFDPTDSTKTSYRWQDVARDKNDPQFLIADKFRKFRTKNGSGQYFQNVVGVYVNVEYLVETNPVQRSTDTFENDAARTVRYMYDLELSPNGDVVGGEWYNNVHPDFLWAIPSGAYEAKKHHTSLDSHLREDWDGVSSLPLDWQEAARTRAQSEGKPLAKIVDALVRLSH